MNNSLLSSPPSENPDNTLFSIITVHHGSADETDPVFCSAASITDQEKTKQEVLLLHTAEVSGLWNKLSRRLNLSKKPMTTLRVLEEKKSNFYDILLRGLPRSQGTFIGFLQPGEQYLPNALAAIEKAFQEHPECDVVISGYYSADQKKQYEALPYSLEYLTTCAPVIPLATFFLRASLLQEGFSFEKSFASLAPAEWLIRLLNKGKKIHSVPTITSLVLLNKITPPRASIQEKLSEKSSSITRLLRPWWKWRHQSAAKKNKTTTLVNFLCYQSDSLAERTRCS